MSTHVAGIYVGLVATLFAKVIGHMSHVCTDDPRNIFHFALVSKIALISYPLTS
jgi:hypothetical protein